MVGSSEVYFVADAVRMQATPLELGLVAALPLAVGGLGPSLALLLLRKLTRRRPLVAASAVGQALAIGALALVHFLGSCTPALLIALASLYQLGGQTAGMAWSSWMGDLVSAETRGRYFARRNAVLHLSTCSAMLAAGLLLRAVEGSSPAGGGSGRGFAMIFAAAALLRLVSATLLLRTPEGRFRGVADRAATVRFATSGRGRVALRLVVLGGLLHFTVYVAAPYFSPYVLETLQFTYLQFTISSVWVVVWKSILLQQWGRRVDRGGARGVFGLAVVLVGLVPLPWMAADGFALVLFAQFCSALAWSGHEIGGFSLLLEATTRRLRLTLFAAQGLLNGLGQIAGSLVGAWVLSRFAADYRDLFGLSAGTRLLVALLVIAWLPREFRRPRGPRAWRITGWRPPGGLGMRPLAGSPESEPGD